MENKTKDYILEFDGICKQFPGVKALDNITFGIKRGSIHCIVGENGAGKSTLMKVINGLYKPESGKIIFDGKSWQPKNSAQARMQGIAMIHQELNVVQEMTVLENMFMGRELHGKGFLLAEKQMRSEAKEILAREGLEYNLDAKMKTLSLAEAQMIEIVKAISINAKIILMDEPTSSLTEKEVDFLFDKIFELKKQGITIIFISHKLEEVFHIADYITVIRDGTHIMTGEAGKFTRTQIIEMMVGREMKEVYPERTPNIGKVSLEIKNFNKKGVFKNVSFSVRKGEILGISGLVGAGRTEIARAVIGLDTKDSGEVYLDGKKLSIKNVNDSIKNGIAMIPEDRRRIGLILIRDIKENISLVALKHVFHKFFIPLHKEEKLVDEMMDRFQVKAPSVETVTRTLSGGNQQKVVLAKWMAVAPKVLIMDEPTRGIDVGAKYEIYKMMNELSSQGLSIIMIDSDMEELLGMSDRILVVKQGEISGELIRSEATAERVMSLAIGEQK